MSEVRRDKGHAYSQVRNKVEALLNLSLRRTHNHRSPNMNSHLHIGSFASDLAASASHLANFASFLGLKATGGVALRRLFL